VEAITQTSLTGRDWGISLDGAVGCDVAAQRDGERDDTAMTVRILLLGLVASCAGNSTTDAQLATKTGRIRMTSETGVGIADASFTDIPPCATIATVDACSVVSCSNATASRFYSAGTLTITGTSINGIPQPLTLDPGSYLYETEGGIFGDGALLMVSASGAEVPAFSASVTAPGRPTITAPAPSMLPFAITRSDGFAFSWSGATAGAVHAVISEGAAAPQVDCLFDGSVGTATVPAAALMMLPTSSQGSVSFEGLGIDNVIAGDWAVSFTARHQAVWQDGSPAGGSATLQ